LQFPFSIRYNGLEIGKSGGAVTPPLTKLKRVTVCPDDLAGAVKPAGAEDASNRYHDAVQIEVIELAEPSGEDECRGSDNRHRDPRKVKEERIQFAIHGVSPFRFAGRLSYRLLVYSIVEYRVGYKIKMRIITKRFTKRASIEGCPFY